MTTSLPFNPEKKQIIQDFLKKQEDSYGGKDLLPKAKISVKGKTSYEPIYRIPNKMLYFNKANGRIKAEIIEKEAEIGREYNIWNENDQQEFKKILLFIRREENDKIKADLINNSQTNPGIITCDGIVINGNRRKALFEELYDEKHDEKYKYLEVQVLPSDINKSELWLIEAGIQLSASQQLDYSPINHLLKLREGKNSGLSEKDIAARLYGVTEETILFDLERLKLIDEYLSDFIGKHGKYYLIKNLNEHFIDLQDILIWANKPRGKKIEWNNGPDVSDINELKLIGFYYIRMRLPHLRIRELRDHFSIEESWKEQTRALRVEMNLNDVEKKSSGIIITVEKEKDESGSVETEEIENTSLTSAEERDTQEELIWKKNREEELKAIYEDAREKEQIHKISSKPLDLAKRALNQIKGIKLNSLHFDKDLDDILGKIIEETNKRRKVLHKRRKK
jgi:hypothetical protein